MDPIIEKLLGFAMVLTRVSALFLVLPIFSWAAIPPRIKISMAVILSIFFSMVTYIPVNSPEVSTLEVIILLANEASYGFAMGLIAALLFSAVKFSGRFIGRQMGLAMAQVLDPLSGDSSQPLAMLLEMIFFIAFLSVNGHHIFLMMISRSYETFPAGSIPTISVLTSGVIMAGSTFLSAGLRLAGPIVAAFLVLMVVLGVFAKTIPQMNILFISMPLKVGMGLLMSVIFMPFIIQYVSEFAEWMAKLMPI